MAKRVLTCATSHAKRVFSARSVAIKEGKSTSRTPEADPPEMASMVFPLGN
jgi:hypothetical protein